MIQPDVVGEGAPLPVNNFVYDYRNQMVEYVDPQSGEKTTYLYDALGRRIGKNRDAEGPSPLVTYFFYDGDRAIEEQDAAEATTATYVYGQYIDEVLSMQRDTNADSTPEDYFFHGDDLFNTITATDAAGTVVERYEYGPFGKPTIYAPNGSTVRVDGSGRPLSSIGNYLLFNGRPYDPETGLYNYRTRYLDPRTGRFSTRDTIGIWGDPINLGNGYSYVGNNPWTLNDPYGLGPWERFSGGLMAVGGASEAILGAGFAYATGGIGAFLGGGAVALHGLDTFQAGLRQTWTGGATPTLTQQGVAAATGSQTAGAVVDFGAGLVGPGVLGLMSRGSRGIHLAESAFKFVDETGGKGASCALKVLNSEFTPDSAKIFQNMVNDAAEQLKNNPELLKGLLSEAELRAAVSNPKVAQMAYGNAMERLLARNIQASQAARQLFQHIGGPRQPDFIGRGDFVGLNFDVTTPGQVASHLIRPGYGQGLNIGTYVRPGTVQWP